MSKVDAKKVRGIVATVLAVCLAIAGLLAYLSYVFYPKNNTTEAGMEDAIGYGFLGEPANTLDVLYVGNSRVYAAVSPLQAWHEHGFTGYDVAGPGIKLPIQYTMLKKAFRTQSPRVVVIETDSFFHEEYPLGDAAFILLADAVPFLEYHSRWKSLTPADFTEPIVTTWSDPHKGFRVGTDVKAADAEAVEDAYEETDEVEYLPRNVRIFIGLIKDLCIEHGATPVLVTVPGVKAINDARTEGVQSLANELGLAYLNLNDYVDEIGIDWSRDSYDGGEHLNATGSKKATRFLGARLKEMYDLSDHRGDEAYAAWDDLYEQSLSE